MTRGGVSLWLMGSKMMSVKLLLLLLLLLLRAMMPWSRM
jgi:hypothetical protein